MIAVVILTYRGDPAVFDRCLASVLASGDADRIVVVDNGRTLDRARVDTIADHGAPPVDLLVTEDNLGFAGGMNVGLSHALGAGASAVALLNDDTVVEPGWLRALRPHLDDARVGAAQPKLLVDRGDPSAPPVLNSVGMRVRADGAGIDIGYGEEDQGQYDGVRQIDLYTAGAVLLSAAYLADVGGFDERYFMYYEDIDLARRGARAGWTYVVEPAAVVHHALSTTARSYPARYRYWQERNRLWWLFRHGSIGSIARGLLLSLARLAKHPIAAQATAIRDGLLGAGWCWRERRAQRLVVTPLPLTSAPRWTAA